MQDNQRTPGASGGDSARNILVIDDDDDVLAYCRLVLEREGYVVRTASTAAEGLAAIKASAPALVILDVMMEEADSGFTLARTIGATLPVILLSSISGAAADLFDTSTLPVKEMLQKPVPPNVLLEKVGRLLGTAT
jgi:DNA-binding response OmpR family regulator